jgi:hypothetical protein
MPQPVGRNVAYNLFHFPPTVIANVARQHRCFIPNGIGKSRFMFKEE